MCLLWSQLNTETILFLFIYGSPCVILKSYQNFVVMDNATRFLGVGQPYRNGCLEDFRRAGWALGSAWSVIGLYLDACTVWLALKFPGVLKTSTFNQFCRVVRNLVASMPVCFICVCCVLYFKTLSYRGDCHRILDHEVNELVSRVELLPGAVVFKEAGESGGCLHRVVGDHLQQVALHVQFALGRAQYLQEVVEPFLLHGRGRGLVIIILGGHCRLLYTEHGRPGRCHHCNICISINLTLVFGFRLLK